jgi:hypothetical protein
VRKRNGRLLDADAKVVKGGVPLAHSELVSFKRGDFRPGVGLF